MIVCKKCKFRNPDKAHYCGMCANPLTEKEYALYHVAYVKMLEDKVNALSNNSQPDKLKVVGKIDLDDNGKKTDDTPRFDLKLFKPGHNIVQTATIISRYTGWSRDRAIAYVDSVSKRSVDYPFMRNASVSEADEIKDKLKRVGAMITATDTSVAGQNGGKTVVGQGAGFIDVDQSPSITQKFVMGLRGDVFGLRLTDCGAIKLPVVKLVKESSGIGLKDAKEVVDNAGSSSKPFIRNLPFYKASALQKQFEQLGASARITRNN